MGSREFAYTGAWQTWRVPAGVKFVDVTLNGAGSGTRRGGRVTGRVQVVAGQVLYVLVGQAGKAASASTGGGTAFGGGAAGGSGRGLAGGRGGGGASAIRMTSTTGNVRAVAAGAGGDSGDGGAGGAGGAAVGQNGSPGTGGLGSTGNATGGTQIQGGNRGTSSAGVAYDGKGATDAVLGVGGAGGTPNLPNTYGGGGGGGGYRGGGGGQAGLAGFAPGGGGGGGSNYTGGLISFASTQAAGATGNGSALLAWVDPSPANQPPSPPTEVTIGGVSAVDEHITRATRQVKMGAKIDDPDTGQTVRLEAQYATNQEFTRGRGSAVSVYGAQATRRQVILNGLTQNTRYWVRLYTRDQRGMLSRNYTTVNFWTNRAPLEPELQLPTENTTVAQMTSVTFSWKHIDPDATDSKPIPQQAFLIRWRTAATPLKAAGQWQLFSKETDFRQYVADPGTFKANEFYEWTVRTRDPEGQWGPFAEPFSFFVTGTSTAPVPLSPAKGVAVDLSQPVEFVWRFRDPDQGDTQTRADVRFRPVNAKDPGTWINVLGTTVTPGSQSRWTLPRDSFQPGVNYEWQARTYDTLTGVESDWSASETFWSIETPGREGGTTIILPTFTTINESLGCGRNRAFVYDKGGRMYRGEITSLQSLRWNRKRDDISDTTLFTAGFDSDCGELLADIHTWIHEIVVFRDGVRVWEGPITRITHKQDGVEIEAKDVMAWVYRRIMRQGYNDAFRIINGEQRGQRTVVERGAQIVMNALAVDDPNILPYLTQFNFPDDAGQSRVVPDYSRTAWEEVDDLAATAGLDYTTAGRRIMLWDTHRPIGRLLEMRDENFSDPPVVTEYGMQLATAFGVTNNNGIFGTADRPKTEYGVIEQLASAYGETEGGTEEVLTPAAKRALRVTLSKQAERNIAGRYPAPKVVRVPDNSTIHPDTNVGINQLIPGVWIPLRSRGPTWNVAQWQKLDLVTVEDTGGTEKVMVTMSPAPNQGEDPDAEVTPEEG